MSEKYTRNNRRGQSRAQQAVAMVDVIMERDGQQYIATPGQAFPYRGDKITRHGAAEIWLYYGVKSNGKYCTSERTAHDLIDCMEAGKEDITLGLHGGIYILFGYSHPSSICTTQVPPGYAELRLNDMSYMESRARTNTSCVKRLLPYTYIPNTARLREACPNCPVHDMYVPNKKGTEMTKKSLIRVDFPISFAQADELVAASDMRSPNMYGSIVEYLMYAQYLFLIQHGLSDTEIYVGWSPEEPQCDHLVSRQGYESLLEGQEETFRIKATAPYNPNDPFGFFDVSRSRLRKCIVSGVWNPTETKSLY